MSIFCNPDAVLVLLLTNSSQVTRQPAANKIITIAVGSDKFKLVGVNSLFLIVFSITNTTRFS